MEFLQAKTASDLLIKVLKKTMGLKVPADVIAGDDFLRGVIAVEQIVNDLVIELHTDGLLTVLSSETS
jgi:hypothetical protein